MSRKELSQEKIESELKSHSVHSQTHLLRPSLVGELLPVLFELLPIQIRKDQFLKTRLKGESYIVQFQSQDEASNMLQAP